MMQLRPERDPMARILAFTYLAVAAGGALLLRLWPAAALRLAHCPLRENFGLPCVTCGGTRAAVALTELRLGDALRENPLVPLAAAILGLWALYAAVATAVPAWRLRIVLTAREAQLLRALAVVIVAGVWTYEIVRLG